MKGHRFQRQRLEPLSARGVTSQPYQQNMPRYVVTEAARCETQSGDAHSGLCARAAQLTTSK